MRQALLALAVVAAGSSAAQAQTAAWADKLFQGHLSHDFGNVPRGAQLAHRFPLKNIYAVDLQIVNVRTSCGCASATPAVRLVKSKESSYIDVTMDARKFTGPKTISIYITVGPEYTSTATLKVSATSRADVVFNPGQISFGVVSRGDRPKQVIDVEYAGVAPWKITEVVTDDAAPFDVSYSELYRRPGQVGYRVTVTLKADAPAGPLRHEMQLKTNDRASPVLAVLVEATVQAALSVAPGVVAMDMVKVGEAKTQMVVVRGNKPFRIVAIEGQGDGVTAALPSQAAAVHRLTIKCQPTKAGALSKQLTIKTDLAKDAAATVTVEATVTE
jgi:hypothetical protein